ncbi:MAG: hypothetical protein R2939_06890 [Kofleriaceae bacterium]
MLTAAPTPSRPAPTACSPAGLVPPLAIGARVGRADEAEASPPRLGTVLDLDFDGRARVHWDDGVEERRRWGADGVFDVTVRAKAPPVALAIGDSVVAAPGCTRCPAGPAGSVGEVARVLARGRVRVRWIDGAVDDLAVGIAGVLPMAKVGGPIAVGDRVVRGRDWKWGDQGSGTTGTVTEIGADDWVQVTWDDGHENSYRWGNEGAYDLQVVARKRP